MSTAAKKQTVNFTKGVYAGTGKFTQPQGTIPRISNLVYTRRGALRTVDGSLIVSSLNGGGATTGQNPFRFIGRFAKTGSTVKTLALQVGGGNILLIDISGSSYSGNLASYSSSYATPNFVQCGDEIAIALGNSVTPHFWDGSSSTAFSNTWTGAGQLPTWLANTTWPQGSAVIPSPANGHIYVATNTGVSGNSQPTFPTGSGATVIDNTILWQEAGSDAPPAPPGAAFVFYHLGYLWAWGTDNTYTALDGPDAIRQSDLLNFTSWNPVNAAFIGKGDGQTAQGGGIFTLGEAGIAATSQLVLFKDQSTYVIQGAFPLVNIQKSPTGVGCVAPGSVQFIDKLGLVRLSYRGVAVFNGQGDEVDGYTDPIRPYLFADSNSGITAIDWTNASLAMAAQTDNPRCYILLVPLVGGSGNLTRAFVYDLTEQSWTVLDLPWSVSTAAYIPANTITNRTLVGGASDGTIRRIFGSDTTWDGTAVSWSLRTPEIGEPSTPSFIRRLNLRGEAMSGSPSLSSATLNYQDRHGNVNSTNLLTPASGVTGSISVNKTLLSANMDVAGSGAALLEGLEYQYTPKPPSRVGGQSTTAALQVVTVIFQAAGSASVSANADSVAITFGTAAPNVNYQVSGAPNWNSDFWITGKTTGGFTVNFNTPAPGDGSGSMDWLAQIVQ